MTQNELDEYLFDGNTQWIYGNWSKYGWGALKVFNTPHFLEDLDFDPEFECVSDVRRYWKNRSNILKLREVTYYKYYKTLCKALYRAYITKTLEDY